MYLHNVLFALTATIGFGSVMGAATEKDGAYLVTNYYNGTTVYKSLTNPQAEPTIEQHESRRSASIITTDSAKFALSKRRTDCWNYQLDHSGTDTAVQGLKDWAGNGHELQSYADSNAYIAIVSKGVMIYYCINRPNSKGNLDVKDVNYALEQMDGKCVRYDASWFAWDNTPEIVGKARAGDSVCQGGCC